MGDAGAHLAHLGKLARDDQLGLHLPFFSIGDSQAVGHVGRHDIAGDGHGRPASQDDENRHKGVDSQGGKGICCGLAHHQDPPGFLQGDGAVEVLNVEPAPCAKGGAPVFV